MLRELGHDVSLYHMNEGHSALLVLGLLNESNGGNGIVALTEECGCLSATAACSRPILRFRRDRINSSRSWSVEFSAMRRPGHCTPRDVALATR